MIDGVKRFQFCWRSCKGESGFTMMEIVVVFMLISVLATMMLGTGVLTARGRARDAKRKQDLATIAKSIEVYVNDYNRYPARTMFSGVDQGASGRNLTSVSNLSDVNGTVYIAETPVDPQNPTNYYVYRVNASGTAWQLYTRLERTDDPIVDRNKDGSYTAADEFAVTCGTGVNCNYGLSSGNITTNPADIP